MKSLPKNTQQIILLVGDSVLILLITLIGFASHGTLETAGGRILTTFIPLLLAWFAVAPFMGCYDVIHSSQSKQLWRPFWAMLVAGPLAGFLRGVMLGNSPILPLFVLIISGVSAFSILAWRFFYLLWLRRKNYRNG